MAQYVEPSRWCLRSEAELAWRHWNGQYVVHHFLSNDTHRLSELAGTVLIALSAASVLDLRQLAEACGADEEEITATLEDLCQLDLVAQC